jgi:threonine synthase
MRYCSTRSTDRTQTLSFEEAVLTGLAPDGGLYIPTSIPVFPLNEILAWADLPFHSLAFNLFRPYIDSDSSTGIPDHDLKALLERSFATFTHPDVTPLRDLPNVSGKEGHFDNLSVLELFHGPTFAFKDVALQV